jgi:hypothetical protein
MYDTIEVVSVPVGEKAGPVEIENSLESLQSYVDGYIEVIRPFEDEDVAVILNEEGKINGLSPNRALTDPDGDVYDIIAGDFLIAGLSEDGEFTSLTQAQIRKYTKMFERPQMFLRGAGDTIVILPYRK